MKKEDQLKINNACMKARANALHELKEEAASINGVDVKRLRSCSAMVYITTNYYILKSYNTIIAVIDKNTDTLYDFLRIVYGYTATSSQHINKFAHDYGAGKWYCSKVYTAR